MSALDARFFEDLHEIEERYGLLDKQERIRVEAWVKKLSELCALPLWKRNRNSYSSLLREMVVARALAAPFDRLPPPGDLKTLPSWQSRIARPRGRPQHQQPQQRRAPAPAQSAPRERRQPAGSPAQSPPPPTATAARASPARAPSPTAPDARLERERRRTAEAKLAALEKRYNEQCEVVDIMEQELNSMWAQGDRSIATIQQLQSEVNECKQEQASAKTMYDSEREEHARRIGTLQAQVEHKDTRIRDLETTLEAERDRSLIIQQDLVRATQSFANEASNLTRLQDTLERSSRAADARMAGRDSSSSSGGGGRSDAEVVRLRAALAAARDENRALEAQIRLLEDTRDHHQGRLQSVVESQRATIERLQRTAREANDFREAQRAEMSATIERQRLQISHLEQIAASPLHSSTASAAVERPALSPAVAEWRGSERSAPSPAAADWRGSERPAPSPLSSSSRFLVTGGEHISPSQLAERREDVEIVMALNDLSMRSQDLARVLRERD